MHEPSALGADGWSLTIGGEVEKPYSISLAELSKLEKHSVVNTLECAGNGRSLHDPKVPGSGARAQSATRASPACGCEISSSVAE